jgi:hypothetical protein
VHRNAGSKLLKKWKYFIDLHYFKSYLREATIKLLGDFTSNERHREFVIDERRTQKKEESNHLGDIKARLFGMMLNSFPSSDDFLSIPMNR